MYMYVCTLLHLRVCLIDHGLRDLILLNSRLKEVCALRA
jgi:hypothetical protein